MGITVMKNVHFNTRLAGQKHLRKGAEAKSPTTGLPRISRMMALAIRFDELIRRGEVKNGSWLRCVSDPHSPGRVVESGCSAKVNPE